MSDLEKYIGLISRALRNPDSTKTFDPNNPSVDSIQNLDDAILYMSSLTPDSIFERNFKEFKTKNNNLAFYIIYELERSKTTGVIPLQHSPSQHIEHIAPKTPSNAASRKHEWAHIRNHPEYNDFIYRLGNLIILESDKNQNVKNKDFNTKKTTYQTSGLTYPKEIALSYSDWDFNNINDRQAQMAKGALKIWNYF